MNVAIRAAGVSLGRAGAQLLGNNIEAYENTIPAMLSDRLRNPKFAGPENPQTGLAAEWEPSGTTMTGLACRLVPGMYLSGREAQRVHNYMEHGGGEILQAGVPVRAGELFEVELWARAQHRPVAVSVELRLPGQAAPAGSAAELSLDQVHWHRRTCRIAAPGTGDATFCIRIPGDSLIVIDQVHLRPVGETHVSQALLDAFGKFPCPVLRFPGGCESCTYHWEHGIGPVHLRPVCDDPVFKYKVYYDFGTDEYLDLCMPHGMRPCITLNTSTATPDDAAAWAAYIRNRYIERGLPVPAAYIMVGNENYYMHEIGHMTGEMYVEQLREFVPPVRAAYPEARILAIGEYISSGLRDAYQTPWRSVVLEKGAGLFDMLVVTRYSGSRSSDGLPLDEIMAALADSLAAKSEDLRRQADSVREAGLDCTLGVVEWNYFSRASHNDHAGFYEPNDIRHCLYAAGLLNAFCRMGEILETANYYSLVNTMGMIHVHDGQVQFSDVVKVLNLYADALPGEVLELAVEAPALGRTGRAVDACMIRTADALFGFLVNFHASEAAEVTLEGLGTVTEAVGLRAGAILTPVESFEPAVEGHTLALPPMSLVRVRCR